MIWENPFLIKHYEGNISPERFLDLFNNSVMNLISEEFFLSTNYISSSPGAGKTTLFKSFLPETLRMFQREAVRTTYKKITQYLTHKKLLVNGEVKLLSSYISCAGNYELLEIMAKEGEREWIFSALLNYRILIAMLRSIEELEWFEEKADLSRITFLQVPDEMFALHNEIINGYKMYIWVCKQEKDLCRYLDNDDGQELPKQTWQLSLNALKLFEPQNILVDGRPRYSKSLIIFDDFHQLTDKQKNFLIQTLYVLRPKVACWIGQRFSGLDPTQIICDDGSLGREYYKNIILDNFWEDKKRFRLAIIDIANRRVREAGLNGVDCFESCITEEFDQQDINKIKRGIKNIIQYIENIHYAPMKYKEIIQEIEKGEYSDFEKAKRYECLMIKIKREEYGQMEFYLGEVIPIDEFQMLYSEWEKVAEYYFCRKNKLPYYYGGERLIEIASKNIEQYLYFAAGIFERCRAVFLKGRKNNYRLNADEQQKCLLSAAKKRWEDMKYRYQEAENVQTILQNIGTLAQRIADNERNSYAGGTITGIGIPYREIREILQKKEEALIIRYLIKCVSDNYMEKKVIEHGEPYVVFYLNRWLCVYFELPLARGGWKALTVERAQKLLEPKFIPEEL